MRRLPIETNPPDHTGPGKSSNLSSGARRIRELWPKLKT